MPATKTQHAPSTKTDQDYLNVWGLKKNKNKTKTTLTYTKISPQIGKSQR